MELNGAVALVTGGNGGLGQRICHALANEGTEIAVVYANNLQRALEQRHTLPMEWVDAGTFSDWILLLTPARAAELKAALKEVLEGFAEAEEGTPDALPFMVNVNAYVQPDVMDRP